MSGGVRRMLDRRLWRRKQKAAAPSRFYGGRGTIHGNTDLHVEVHNGDVVAVWYRCQMLPFTQVNVGEWRAFEMRGVNALVDLPGITGVEVLDK